MKTPSSHYYDLEFDGAPCPTIQEYLAVNKAAEEGERMLHGSTVLKRGLIAAAVVLGVAVLVVEAIT